MYVKNFSIRFSQRQIIKFKANDTFNTNFVNSVLFNLLPRYVTRTKNLLIESSDQCVRQEA